MTTLIGWVAVDPRGPAALYLASDSRISWGIGREWDVGRKLFASHKYPDVFGYYGEVLFPSLVLAQLIETIDFGGLPDTQDDPAARLQAIIFAIKSSFEVRKNVPRYDFGILYATRILEGMKATFRIWIVAYSAATNAWSDTELKVGGQKSELIVALGSGSGPVKTHMKRALAESQGDTSRAVFWSLCDSIQSGNDRLSGGAPQLVGLYRSFAARTFGVVVNGERYLNGLKLAGSLRDDAVEWRDQHFQRVDGETLQLVPEAQRHVRPKRR